MGLNIKQIKNMIIKVNEVEHIVCENLIPEGSEVGLITKILNNEGIVVKQEIFSSEGRSHLKLTYIIPFSKANSTQRQLDEAILDSIKG